MLQCCGILLLCVLLSQAATHQTANGDFNHDADFLRRLDQLERLVSQQEQQSARERREWKAEKEDLQKRLEVLEQNLVDSVSERKDMKKNTDSLLQSEKVLYRENQNLKSEVRILYERLDHLTHEKQALKDCVKQTPPSVPKAAEKLNVKAFDGRGQSQLRSRTVQESGDVNTRNDRSQVSVRSDDHDPLEAVVSQMSEKLTHVTADLQAQEDKNVQQDHEIQQSRSSTFVRWGRSVCPASTQLVYSGWLGGSETVRDTGAATNHLCMSDAPVFTRSFPTGERNATVYGGEYEVAERPSQDVVCSVCQSPRPSNIMVPGTNICPSDWTMEYTGYILASATDHKTGSQFICVDTALEARPGTSPSLPANELFYSVTTCGTLPCPPYQSGKVVLCAVCSK